METYFNGFDFRSKGLNRHGVTLIPPISLKHFENILKNDSKSFSKSLRMLSKSYIKI